MAPCWWKRDAQRWMDRNHLERCMDTQPTSTSEEDAPYVSLEAEIPEVLYQGMKAFIGSVPGDEFGSGPVPLSERLFRACGHRALSR